MRPARRPLKSLKTSSTVRGLYCARESIVPSRGLILLLLLWSEKSEIGRRIKWKRSRFRVERDFVSKVGEWSGSERWISLSLFRSLCKIWEIKTCVSQHNNNNYSFYSSFFSFILFFFSFSWGFFVFLIIFFYYYYFD